MAQQFASSSPSEFNALQVQFALAMHRPDLAKKIYSEQIANKDDSGAAKLVTALLNLFDPNRAADAYMCYSDLIAQFEGEKSVVLGIGRAAANMQRGLYAEAQEDLENLPQDPDVLANLASCAAQQGKAAEARAFYEELKSACPTHALVEKRELLKRVFA